MNSALDLSMNVSVTVWLVTIAAILAMIILDLVTVSAKPHEVKFKEATLCRSFILRSRSVSVSGYSLNTGVHGELNTLQVTS